MHKLIKRYQAGGGVNGTSTQTGQSTSVTANTNNSGAASLMGNGILGFSGWSSGEKIVNDSKALLDKFTSNFKPLPTSGGDSLLGKVGGLKGLGQKALGAVGGLGGAFSLGENLMGSIIGKPDINSGAFNTVNSVLNLAKNIPGIGGVAASGLSFVLNGINSLGARNLDKVNNDLAVADTLKRSGDGYGNFMDDWNEAKSLSGKSVGAFTGTGKYNRKIWEANHQMAGLQHITGQQATNETLTAQMNDRWNERVMNDMNGGFGNISFGRKGLKLDKANIIKIHRIVNESAKNKPAKQEEVIETPQFKEGGKMNVIPEGSLHARLHHMENAEGLTKKGIPVISIKEGGEVEQQAEIELNEIIFNLEVTTELEKLMEDGSENAAIEAGKLLVKEIFENTDDRTGLIKQLTEPKEETSEDLVKQHRVV